MISKLKRRKKRSSLEKKRRVKYGLRISRERSGLHRVMKEAVLLLHRRNKPALKPALETRSKAAGACLEASSWATPV